MVRGKTGVTPRRFDVNLPVTMLLGVGSNADVGTCAGWQVPGKSHAPLQAFRVTSLRVV